MAAKKLRPEFLAGHPSIDLISVDEVAHLLGVSKYTIWRRVKSPSFPQPIKLSAKCTRWRIEEIRGWTANAFSPKAINVSSPHAATA